jgi:hypothetical protein
MTLPTRGSRRPARLAARPVRLALLVALLVTSLGLAAAGPAAGAAPAAAGPPVRLAAAAACTPIPQGVPVQSSGRAAVRAVIGVAKTMGVPIKGQIIAVMVMYQETSLRNLANDGTSLQSTYWSSPGKAYWMAVTKLSLKYPHDYFGYSNGAHDTDSIGLFQQRPSSGWGNYGTSTGITDPAAAVKRLLDPRWEAMAFFGGPRNAAPNRGLLDVYNWQNMAPANAANAVQGSLYPSYYAKWEQSATTYVNANQDAPPISLPWAAAGPSGTPCTSPLVISLRARANGKLVTAESAGAASLIANRSAIGPWEQFDLISQGYTTIALRAHANNRYVSAANAGASPLVARATAVGDTERFTLISNSGGTISLRAQVNGKLVCAESAGTRPLIANRAVIGPWEQFDLVGQ